MSTRGIDGDLVGIDDVTVVDPDLPAWHIIQRTTHQGRTYKVYHGPLGEYAESKKQAILLSSGVPLSAAMLAPKTRPAPGVRLVDAKSAASHQGSPARAPRAVSPLLAYAGGGASPLLDPVDAEPTPSPSNMCGTRYARCAWPRGHTARPARLRPRYCCPIQTQKRPLF